MSTPGFNRCSSCFAHLNITGCWINMRRHKIASQILLILSIFNFVLAVPVAVREMNEVRVNVVDVAKVGMTASEKRMDPGDQFSTNAEYLTDVSTILNSDSTTSSTSTSEELDTATSRQPLSTGSHPGPAGNPSPPHSASSYSVSTDDGPPSHSVSTGYTPQSPPPLSVSTTDDQSSPSMEPQLHPEAPESENIFGKLMKVCSHGALLADSTFWCWNHQWG
ncbi:hypothetical protein F5888DRAFT_1631307 [Russula emetica]|nr:hypothetical protein F5888DRAFT_1631307 [Russula emetica]